MQKAEVLGQLAIAVCPADGPRADPVAQKDVARPVVPSGHTLDPVAYVVRYVFEQSGGFSVVGKESQIAGQKQQKGLGAVVGLGFGLVPVQALGSNPGLEVIGQRAKPHRDPLVAADQIMRKEGQREIGLVLAALVFVRPVAANALLDPQREFAPQCHIVRVGLCQFVDHFRVGPRKCLKKARYEKPPRRRPPGACVKRQTAKVSGRKYGSGEGTRTPDPWIMIPLL